MDKKTLEKYIKAGKIAAEAKKLALELVKADSSYLDVTEKIEALIQKNGGGLAFPINISVNEIAAHDCAQPGDSRTFKKGELIKIDIGVHIDGCIADTAISIDLGDNKILIQAAEKAVSNAIKMMVPGTRLSDISTEIERTIREFNVNPIKNLTGHQMEPYVLHGMYSLPNVRNNDSTILEKGQVWAIEPFTTRGDGFVINSKDSGIFHVENIKSVRLPVTRLVLNWLSERQSLPFCTRWVLQKFPTGRIALSQLKTADILYEYPILKERSCKPVAQFEETVIVDDKPIVTTQI